MGNSVLIKLQAEDNLTPKLQANMDKLGELYGKVKELETALKTLRNQKGGIVSGDIKSDIENVAKLQTELKALQKDGNLAQIKKKEAEINRAVNQEIINLTNSLREQRDERARLSIITEKSYAQFKKDEQAKKKNTKSTQDNTGALKDNNAVRNSSINSLVRHIRQVETLVVSVYGLKRAYDTLLGSGINLHRQIESQTAGIAALITANTRLASGSKDLIKHFKIASQTAEQTMKKIKTASVETAATFPELTAIFQQAVGGALGAGKAMGDTIEKQIDNTITLSKRMSNIASAIGMPMQQVNEEIRSIIEGTIDINSRIAKMIGITNEEIRKAKTEQDGLVKYLNEKLKPFDALADIQSFDRLLARIKDKIDNIKLEATEEAFKEIKKHLKDVDAWLAKNNGEIVKTIAEGIKALSEAIAKIVKFTVEWKDEITAVVKAFAVFKAGSWLFGGLVDFRKEIGKTAKEVGVLSATLKGLKINPYLLATAGAMYAKDVLEEDARGYADKKYWERQSDADKTNRILYGEPAKYATTVEEKIDALEKRIEAFKKKIAETPDASAAAVKSWQNQIDLAEKSIKNLSKTSDTAKKDVQAVIQDLIAMEKVPADVAKILEKVGQADFSSKFDEQRHKITASIQILVNYLSTLDLSAENAANQLLAINTALGNLEKDLLEVDKKEAEEAKRNKEEADRAAKQAHDEAMRRAKEKADWQIKHAKAVGDTEKALRLELQQYEKELQELISKGYITREQKADFLRQKEKEYHEKKLKEQKEIDESFEKEFDDRRNAQKDFYTAIGDYQKAAVVTAELELKKLVELAQKAGVVIDKDLAEKLKKIAEENAKKGFEKFNKEAKKSFKDIKNSWADTVSSMSKTVDDGFFNFFIGKTKSLKKALKDMGTNLMRDFISPYARTLSQGLAGGFGALLGGGSNLASVAAGLGLAKNDRGGWDGTIGGTTVELSSTGQILRGADALDKSTTSLLSSVSNLQSAYSLLTSGYTGFISSFTSTPALNAASWLSMHGYAGLGQGVYGFGTGVKGALTATQFSGAGTAPYMAGSAFGGAALGYGIGYLGDKLFKANTYASTGGALGGAAGGLIAGMKAGSSMGPWGAVIGAVAGALIGGAFGKKKATGSGISVLQDITAGDTLSNQNIRSYVDMQKKGWFSKKSWTEMSDLDDASMREIGAQLRSMDRMASRAGALASLTLKSGKYSGESLANEGFAKAILRSMTGQAEQMWAEVTESGGKKRKGLLGKIGGVFEKAMKFSPSSIINRITKPLDDAVSKAMNKAGLGAIDDMARGMRDEFGKASDGNIFGLKSSRKIDDLLNLSRDETNKNQKLVDNPEFARMWKDWGEQAKKANKKVIELMSESLGAIADSYKSLELLTVRNPIKQVEISMRQAFESFTDAAEALKLDIPKQMGSIADLSVERMAQAYRKAIASDFTKSNVDSLNGLVKAYEAAKKAQDEYTKAVVNFTQSVASTQGGFYQSLGFDTNFLTLQNLYTRLRNVAGALESDLGEKEKKDINKIGSTNDPRAWATYFHNMSAAQMQEFLARGNVEMRAELVKLISEYKNFTNQNGGREVWLKSFSDIEAISKQIAALKLAEAAQNTLNLQREQLNILNKQKSVLEKVAQTAQRLRDSVIDENTSGLNYRFALERARIAYNAKDYDSKAYENLNTAVAKQEQYLKQTAGSYAEYKLSILKMASEIEGITGSASLDDINRQIKRLEGLLNSSSNSQLSALEAQKEALIKGANDQINAMELLLGSDSPIVRYLKEALGSLKEGKAPGEYKGSVANVNNGALTANGATINSQLDRDINSIYKDVLGRSVEQGGLDAWKRKAQLEGLSKEQLRAQIEATARAITGGNSKQDFIEWSKRQGLKPYAEGGIVTRPTRALIGEAGAEAVIPLKNGAVRAQIVGGDNSELVSLMREGVYLMKEINKNTREGTMVLKDVTNGTEFLVKAV